MFRSILDKNDQFKLDVASFISKHTHASLSIRSLSKQFDCSHLKMQIVIEEMMQDFSDCYDAPILTIDNAVQFNNVQFSYNVYQQYLIRHSFIYKFVLTTLMEPNKKLMDFCQENFISRASLSRKLQPLLQYLAQHQASLNVSKMKWNGTETIIRQILFIFLWIGSHGEDILNYNRTFDSEKQLIAQLQITRSEYINKKELLLILVISRLRTEQGYHLDELALKDLVFPNPSQEEVEAYLRSYVKEEHIIRQLNFLSYLVFYAPYYLTIKDTRITYVNAYYDQLIAAKDPLVEMQAEFEAFCYEQILPKHMDDDSKKLLHVNIFTTFLNYSLTKGHFPLLSDFYSNVIANKNQFYIDLNQQLTDYFKRIAKRKHYKWMAACLPNMVDTLTFNLLPQYEYRYETSKLVVGLVSIPNHLILQDIKNFLDQFIFLEIRLITDNFDGVDFFITTFPKFIPNQERPFFLVDISKDEDYQLKLFEQLQFTYKQKQKQKFSQAKNREIH